MISYLLDTHVFLWVIADDERLSRRARKILEKDPCAVSTATVWEMAIKCGLGKLKLNLPVAQFFEKYVNLYQFDVLPIHPAHAAAVEMLPMHHKDPFDRMLVAQALLLNFRLITFDEHFDAYDIETVR